MKWVKIPLSMNNCFQQLTIFAKFSILDIWLGSEYTSTTRTAIGFTVEKNSVKASLGENVFEMNENVFYQEMPV